AKYQKNISGRTVYLCLCFMGCSLYILLAVYLLFKYVYKECIHYANEACKEESPEQSDSGA
ncbi:TPA: hypothetical protein ACHK89_004388, partial [Escherichia coli]